MGTILCATRGGEGSQTTHDQALALAQERGEELVFLFVVDISFLSQMAAPIVVDVESRLEMMGQFQLALIQERAAAQGMQVQTMVRRGRLRPELVAAARELDAELIVLGRPARQTAVFEEDTLQVFARGLQAETGIEVRIV
ncbi:MAG: universal stress protein [Anaerolineae bacterium]|jgi:nucleotide-binding universal stress UspA family protein